MEKYMKNKKKVRELQFTSSVPNFIPLENTTLPTIKEHNHFHIDKKHLKNQNSPQNFSETKSKRNSKKSGAQPLHSFLPKKKASKGSNNTTTEEEAQDKYYLLLKRMKEKENKRSLELSNINRGRKKIKTPSYVGLNALKSYYGKFKSLNRCNDHVYATTTPVSERTIYNLWNSQPNSASLAYLNTCNTLLKVPQPMGLVRRMGHNVDIDVGSYKMGDSYALALGESMRHMEPNIEKLNISSNRLSEKGTCAVLQHLNKSLKSLDLSNNNIGLQSIQTLSTVILQKADAIRILNLENCRLKNNALTILCDALQGNISVRELNLSKNAITDFGCETIGSLLKNNDNLEALSLHWNLIRAYGATALIKAMLENPRLRTLDLSWNGIHSGTMVFCKKLSEYLSQNIKEGLVHLDISHNDLVENEIQVINEGLNVNHTVYGVHVEGNDGYNDTKGFFHPKKNLQSKNNTLVTSHFTKRIQNKDNTKYHSNDGGTKHQTDNCWICDGWNEEEIKWTPGSGRKPVEPVYVHLSMDNYEPDLMYEETPGTYVIWRMFPPGVHKLFFSFNGEPLLSKTFGEIPFNKKLPNIDFGVNGIQTVELEKLNMKKVNKRKSPIFDSYYRSRLKTCIPRPEPGQFFRPNMKRPRTPWTFPISLFFHYRTDTEERIGKCFELDWSMIKKPKMSEQDLIDIKKILKENYRIIRETFKVQAAIGKNSALPCLSWNAMTEFVFKKLYLIDGEFVKLADSDRMFKFINGKKIEGNNSATGLVRFEFTEFLMRLALKRYHESEIVPTRAEAIVKLFENHLIPECSHINCQKFRDEEYWNEECDNIYKANLNLLQYIFEHIGGTHKLPGEQSYMTDDEFYKLFSENNLISETFADRDIYISYYSAMQTQIDEITKSKHMKMHFVEFLEALARACSKLSLRPWDSEEEDWPWERCKAQSLAEKIENLLPLLLRMTKKEFKERYEFPERNPETNLFKVPKYKSIKPKNTTMYLNIVIKEKPE